jgi:hypothetical protein
MERRLHLFATATLSVNELLVLVMLQKFNSEPFSFLLEHTVCCAASKWEIAAGKGDRSLSYSSTFIS